METFFTTMGEKGFRVSQVMKWIYHHQVTDFEQMTNLSKKLRDHLKQNAIIKLPEMVLCQNASDNVKKFLFRVDTENCVETVYIPEKQRGTLCISSQIGCALNCSFCSTARQGFNRNLSTAEIIGQIWAAKNILKEYSITNIVLMGMGEPLLNFDNVVRAINLMTDDLGFGLSKRKVTLSTAGIAPAIERLEACSDVSLAVSLHAPEDNLRNQLVPINKKYPLVELIAACKKYIDKEKKRKITFEYVMIDGVNDQPKQARQLITLLSQLPSKVNLIPFNPFPGSNYKPSPESVIAQFQTILSNAGIVTITRRTRGNDIDAACGQLVGKVNDRTKRQQKFSITRLSA